MDYRSDEAVHAETPTEEVDEEVEYQLLDDATDAEEAQMLERAELVESMKFLMRNYGEVLLAEYESVADMLTTGDYKPPVPKPEEKMRRKKNKKGSKRQRKKVKSVQIDPRKAYKSMEDIVLNFLDSEDCELNVASNEEQEFLEVLFEAALDSGAGDHVAKQGDAPGYKVEESWGSRVGQNFIGAGGHRMKNQGQIKLMLRAPNGDRGKDIRTTVQCADVTRPLLSVSKICDAGMKVTFDQEKAVIIDQKGKEVCRFMRKKGLYVASMKIRNPNYKPKDKSFAGRGAK